MQRPLRVLMSTPTQGAMWSSTVELVTQLASLDVEVALATMGGPLDPAQVRSLAHAHNLEIYESEHAFETAPEPWSDVDSAGAWLRFLAARIAPDVIHLNGYSHAAARFAAPTVVAAHGCLCSRWRAVHGQDPPDELDEYHRRVAAGLRAAAAVVAPTRAILHAVLEAHDVSVPGRVIPCGRDPVRFLPHPDRLPYVLTVGSLRDDADGLQTLDACAETVPWPIHVAGPESPVDGAPIAPRWLRLLDQLDGEEIAAWMARASIFAMPSRYTPFGLSAVEAALAGCALVLGDLASLREVWDDAAMYVTPGDGEQLAAVLLRLTSDPVACAALAERGRARALELTPARMAAGYRQLYDELAP